jgi:hypothetical protein
VEFNFGLTPFKYRPSVPFKNLNSDELSPESIATAQQSRALIRPRLLRQDASSTSLNTKCTICFDAKPIIILKPCNHCDFCELCAFQLDQCPICRAKIEERQIMSTTTANVTDVQIKAQLDQTGKMQLGDSAAEYRLQAVPDTQPQPNSNQ